MSQEAQALAQAKAYMRGIAAEYARGLPGLDTHSLMAGLEAELKFMPMGERDGAYDPENGVVLINSQLSSGRQRFTLAHEISHALLLGDDDLLSDIHDAFEGDALEEVIETLCNVGAASILIPASLLEEVLQLESRAQGFAKLVQRADVSNSAAAIALADSTPEPVLYALCVGAQNQLSVRVSASSPRVKYSLSTGTPIPAEHPISLALATNMPLEKERSYVPFRSGRKVPAYVDAFPYFKYVYASFLLDKPTQ